MSQFDLVLDLSFYFPSFLSYHLRGLSSCWSCVSQLSCFSRLRCHSCSTSSIAPPTWLHLQVFLIYASTILNFRVPLALSFRIFLSVLRAKPSDLLTCILFYYKFSVFNLQVQKLFSDVLKSKYSFETRFCIST